MKRLLLMLLLVSSPALCEDRMSPAEFEAYVSGRTLYYGQHGLAYGVEEYLSDKRVRWSFLDGDCIEGHWFAVGEDICFAYDGHDQHQCWQFFRSAAGLHARVSSDPDGEALYEVHQSSEAMQCRGPRIGV